MPDARTFSPSYATAQQAADAALASIDGITIYFRVSKHGTMRACEHLARSFQTSFTSLRARARRLSARRLGEEHGNRESRWVPRDSFARGKYDILVCQRTPLADGWSVTLAQGNLFLDQMEIIDNATGLPLETIGKDRSELLKYIQAALTHPPTLTPKEYYRALEIDPEVWMVEGDPENLWCVCPPLEGEDTEPTTYTPDEFDKMLDEGLTPFPGPPDPGSRKCE